VRRGDLSRGLALSGNGALCRSTRRARRISSSLSRSGTRQLQANNLCRSGKHVSREGGTLSRRREHLLLCYSELRRRRLAHHLGGGPTRRNVTLLSALRKRRTAVCRSRSLRGDRTARVALQVCLEFTVYCRDPLPTSGDRD